MSEPTSAERKQAFRLRLVLALVSLFFIGEFAGAVLSRSAVLKADALHLLMDVFALGLSLAAMRLARRPASRVYTFGFRRVEALAAVFNAFLVLAVVVEILRDGLESMEAGERPDSSLMLIVSLVALVVNGFSAWLLHGAVGHHAHDDHAHHHHAGHAHHEHHVDHAHDHAHDHGAEQECAEHGGVAGVRARDNAEHGHELNLRGAFLHLLGDALGAVAAVVAAVVIRAGGPVVIDPIAGAFVAVILLVGAVRLLRDAGRVLLEGAPRSVDVDAVHALLRGIPGVAEVDDVRVWTLGAGENAVAARLVPHAASPQLGEHANRELKRAFAFRYAVVQVDSPRRPGAEHVH